VPSDNGATVSDHLRQHDLCEFLLAEARWWAEEGRFWQTNRLRGPANAQPVLFPWEAAG